MRLKTLCFGLIGFCLFGADRAFAQRPTDMIPPPPGAGTPNALGRNGGSSNPSNDRANESNERLKRYDKELENAAVDYAKAKSAFDEWERTHPQGSNKVGGARETDKTYDDRKKARDDAFTHLKNVGRKIASEEASVRARGNR